MVPSLPCCPVSRQCLWKKTLIEKKTFQELGFEVFCKCVVTEPWIYSLDIWLGFLCKFILGMKMIELERINLICLHIIIWSIRNQKFQKFKDVGSFIMLLTEAATEGVLWKKMFLEILQNSQENTCAEPLF